MAAFSAILWLVASEKRSRECHRLDGIRRGRRPDHTEFHQHRNLSIVFPRAKLLNGVPALILEVADFWIHCCLNDHTLPLLPVLAALREGRRPARRGASRHPASRCARGRRWRATGGGGQRHDSQAGRENDTAGCRLHDRLPGSRRPIVCG
jgi:hypothetical protein